MRYLHIIILAVLLSSCSMFGAINLEQPEYRVISKHNQGIEIRKYENTMLVSTETKGKFSESGDKNFKRLFKYISGENEKEKKISMTSPVFVSLDKGSSRKMSFVVPKAKSGKQNPPEPSSSDVVLDAFEDRKVAVIKFAGRWDEERFKTNESKLRTWLDENGYEVTGNTYAAAYNPPWTIPFLRTNEVHIELAN